MLARRRSASPGSVQNEGAPLLSASHTIHERIVTSSRKDCGPSCRMVMLVMSFLAFINIYCLRVNLSVALVAMVNRTIVVDNSSDDSCAPDVTPLDNSSSTPSKEGEFNWDTNQQGLILGAFFYGYIFTQIPGGWIAGRWGGKWPLGLGILCTSLLTMLTPVAARWHINALVAVRVLEGIGEGVTFPSMHALLAKWAPPGERSKMGTFVYAGAQLGTVVGMPLSGVLCHSDLAGGWPSVFYVFGTLGCLWFILWTFLVFNSPREHPRISHAERDFIESQIGEGGREQLAVPWKSVLTSLPVWACAAAHFSNNWGYYTLLTCLPTYMKDVLHFDIAKNGALSGLPYLASWFTMTMSGQMADCIRSRRCLSTRNTRKLFNLLGLLLPGVFLIITGFVGCDRYLTVALVIIAVGCSGVAGSGYHVNHLDLAPPFSGLLMGMTNTLATIPGFLGPQIAGALTHSHSTRVQWQKVFYIATGIYVAGALFNVIFGAGEAQEWAKYHPSKGRATASVEEGQGDETRGETHDSSN